MSGGHRIGWLAALASPYASRLALVAASRTGDERTPYHQMFAVFGTLMLGGALFHLRWETVARDLPQLASLTPVQADLLSLLNLAIAGVLALLAALAFWLALSSEFSLSQLRGFAALMASLWAFRLLLEVCLPVGVPLLGPHTSATLKVALGAVLVLLALPELGLRLRRGSAT